MVSADAQARSAARGAAPGTGRGRSPKRLRSDNAWSYVENRSRRELLAGRGDRSPARGWWAATPRRTRPSPGAGRRPTTT